MPRKIILFGLIVSLGLLLGRLMGFVREIGVAASFGVSAEADVVVIALTVPDILVSLLVAGGVSAVLIPEFKSLSKRDAFSLFFQTSVVVAIIFTILVFFLGFVPSFLLEVFAPGLSEQSSASAQNILSDVLWLIPLTVLAGVTTAYLQAQEKFIMPAMGTFIFNACIVVGLFEFIQDSKRLDLLVFFIILGGFLRWLSQLWVLRNDIYWLGCFSRNLLSLEMFYRYCQAVMAIGLLILYPVIVRSFASLTGDGGMAAMNYAIRLVDFPLGVTVSVFAMVLFPRLSESYVNGKDLLFSNLLRSGILWSVIIASSMAGVIYEGSYGFVSIVFGWGGMGDNDIRSISELVEIIALSLPFQALMLISIVAFNARKNTRPPMIIGGIGVLLLLPLAEIGLRYFEMIGLVQALLVLYVILSVVYLCLLFRMDSSISVSYIFKVLLLGVIGMSLSSYSFAYLMDVMGDEGVLMVVGALFICVLITFFTVCVARYVFNLKLANDDF